MSKKSITKKLSSSSVKSLFSFGEVFSNPYLGSKFTEVLNMDKTRVGWVWAHTDGRIVVSPHLGFYIWFDDRGENWTVDSAATWLAKKRA
tara:strand:+ start:592 stop:861 length:270 start_codon:yes stop_codon:yes gene_type:complete